MKRLFRRMACVLLCALLCRTAALAADVTVSGGVWARCGLAAGDFISGMAETGQGLWLLVTDGETSLRDRILCLPRDGSSPAVYRPAEGEEEMSFLSMAPDGEGRLWAVLGDPRGACRVVLFQDGERAASVDCGGRPVLGEGRALWREDRSLLCWDGEEIRRYPLPADCGETGELALLGGSPCFVDRQGGRVVCLREDGQSQALFSLPAGEAFQTASLVSCGNEAYLSYRAASGAGLIRLSDGRKLLETAGTLLFAWRQADGTDQLALAAGGGNLMEYEQLSLQDGAAARRHVETYLPNAPAEQPETGEDGLPTGWRFTDSGGNQWIFHLRFSRERGAVTRVLPDGTAVRCLAEAAEPRFPLYVRGAAVDFAAPPYLSDTGHTMAPVRGLAGILGAQVDWDGGSRTVTVRQGEHTLLLTVGASTALADGVSVPLAAPAVIVEGHTMAPLRFLAEALGWTVRWEAPTVYVA